MEKTKKLRSLRDKPATIRIGKLESDIKIRDHTIKTLEAKLESKNSEIKGYYENLQNTKNNSILAEEQVKREYEQKVDKVRNQYQKKIDKYSNNFAKNNEDIVEEVALKLARKISQERLADIEAKYKSHIEELKIKYEGQLKKVKDDFFMSNKDIIEQKAREMSQEYIKKNFPLD